MKNNSRKGENISRRGVLPLLGGGLLIPFLGFGNSNVKEKKPTSEEYQTLLKPDGTAVKVKVKTINESKVIKKNISNNSLLNWLGKKH